MKSLIIANWKMNPSNSKDAFDLASAVARGVKTLPVDVVLCPPFVYIPQLVSSGNVFIGAQDCFWEDPPTGGAFTGEISARMLKNLGCSHVIVGHSERKTYLGETLEMVNKKVRAALLAKLIPIVCIGEDIENEIPALLRGLAKEDMKHLALVFEPKWAISTGEHSRPATLQQVKKAISRMRETMQKMFGETISFETAILYGGTVNSGDIQTYLKDGLAQGVLVGAASLDAEEFVALAKKAA